ncbi:MAG: mechanosensitive ion channel family protein [Gammaproteobacteria bacterium]|nr:mechanosensitive ion channel family protein [Gammaproteobacteria bacterium]
MLDSLIEKLQPVIGFFGDYPYVKALIVFLLTLAVANLVTMTVSKILLKLAHKTNNTLDNRIITLLHRPLLWTVILIGSLAAVNLLELPTNAYGIASSLVSSVLIFFWSLFVMQLLRSILRTLSHSNREQSLIRNQTLPLFDNLVIIVVVTITVYLLFEAWGIDMTAWIASAGIVGIAVGFAAQCNQARPLQVSEGSEGDLVVFVLRVVGPPPDALRHFGVDRLAVDRPLQNELARPRLGEWRRLSAARQEGGDQKQDEGSGLSFHDLRMAFVTRTCSAFAVTTKEDRMD